MLITTLENPAALAPSNQAMAWPTPRILLTGTDGAPSTDRISAAEAHYLVIDLAARATSRFDALRIAMTRAIRARIEMSGPLLYAPAGLPDDEIRRLEQAASRDPWLVDHTVDAMSGDLTMFALGERVVTNPIFSSFFNNLHEGMAAEEIPDCIATIEEHLVWREGGQV